MFKNVLAILLSSEALCGGYWMFMLSDWHIMNQRECFSPHFRNVEREKFTLIFLLVGWGLCVFVYVYVLSQKSSSLYLFG